MSQICAKCQTPILHPMTDFVIVNGVKYFPMLHQFKDLDVILCAKCESIWQTEILNNKGGF